MQSIVTVGSKQYIVGQGDTIVVDKIDGDPGTQVTIDDVRALMSKEKTILGTECSGHSVTARIVRHEKGPKLQVFKYKRRKAYDKKTGHRQHYTVLSIDSIS